MRHWHCTFYEKHHKIHVEKRDNLFEFIKTNYSIKQKKFNLT